MERRRGRRGAPARRSRPASWSWRCATGSAGVLLAAGLVLLPLQVVQAQGNPALVIRQLQARVASLSRLAQRLNEQLTAERQMRVRQQMAVATQSLQRLQAAVNAAAAAGDPTAQAVRSASAPAVLEKLAAQFETRARLAREGKTVASVGELTPPDLSGARLSGAGLRGAKLAHADLEGADLQHADLTHAALPGANLRGAKLQGATLTGADLTDADLKDLLYDVHTRWPEGYDPQKEGALLVK